ncbi:DGAT1/2-independent enzyme synthesizing storage lipids-like [Pituophis catenifer annectens]|uniref:DGAT1/2-independent enzyme synthesizing storage lipids-like n=1 Tax=Pituophis catenifer annectens TaxID=94852 RepID=UPI0039938829
MDLYLYNPISNMTVENICCTLRNEFTIWSTYVLERYAGFMVYPLILLVILIILYYPYICALSLIYLSNAILFVWKKIGSLPEDINSKKWDKPKQFLSLAFDWIGKLLHSYEISGLENLPNGPGILVYYHGAIPSDYFFFVQRIYRLTGKFIYSVLDHIVFHIPGIRLFLSVYNTDHPTREKCVNVLKQGQLMGVAPGGVREQNYGNNHYKLIWGKRKGFAQIAIDAKVPVIPLFTQNIREGYITYGNIRPMRWFYERNRWLIFPLYGGFPVKFITHIGEQIPYDPNISPEKLTEKTQRAIEALQNKHQKIPGSILHALKQRFETHNKDKQ